MGILKNNGYITVEPSGQILLTEDGREKAESVYHRHLVITEFLEGLGVSKENAELDACKIEHIISEETFLKIKEHFVKQEY